MKITNEDNESEGIHFRLLFLAAKALGLTADFRRYKCK